MWTLDVLILGVHPAAGWSVSKEAWKPLLWHASLPGRQPHHALIRDKPEPRRLESSSKQTIHMFDVFHTLKKAVTNIMSQPMLEITAETTGAKKTTPHLLPCRIHHNGPVEPTDAFWNPDSLGQRFREPPDV